MSAPAAPRRKLIFLHTPKCGGSSLYYALRNTFGPDAIYSDYAYIDGKRSDGPAHIHQPIIYGHFPAKKYETQTRARWGTLLREPVDRALSMYFNWKLSPTAHLNNQVGVLRQATRAGSYDLIDFIRHPSVRNRLSGYYFAGFDMRRFDVIISHAHYEAGVARLGRELDAWLVLAPRNVSADRASSYLEARSAVKEDQNLMTKIRDGLRDELDFYERAMQLPSVVLDHPVALKNAVELVVGKIIELASPSLNKLATEAAARRIATANGYDWSRLGRDERRRRARAAKAEITEDDRRAADRRRTRHTAERLAALGARLPRPLIRTFI